VVKKHVVCLEGEWYGWKDRSSIRPMLEALERVTGSNFHLRPCFSRDQLAKELLEIGKRPSFGLVDISVHGEPGRLYIGSDRTGERVSLEELADMADDGLAGRILSLSGCDTLRCSQRRIDDFMGRTNVRMLTGYTRYVDWVEAAAFQFLFLGAWTYYKTPGAFKNALHRRYPDLIERLGFRVYE
jgi:hypothetical protein